MYVRIKVIKTIVSLLESETNRALKELEADNKIVLDTQILRAHPTGDLLLSIIKYVDDEERISLNDISDIEDEFSEIKSSTGRVW